jgi:hypothetical protein
MEMAKMLKLMEVVVVVAKMVMEMEMETWGMMIVKLMVK